MSSNAHVLIIDMELRDVLLFFFRFRTRALHLRINRRLVSYSTPQRSHMGSCFITLRAKLSGTMYCYRSCLCTCLQQVAYVCLWVCYHDNSKLRASILTKLASVGKGSDHLQLIKFWSSRTPGKGVCGGAKTFGSALLQPAHSVCISLSTFFISS